jgi:hypothetical protein
MPAYKVAQIHNALESKLQATVDKSGDHVRFLIYDGQTLVSRTYYSHGTREIGDRLMSAMARQMGLSNRFWIELCRCDHDRAAFLATVRRS